MTTFHVDDDAAPTPNGPRRIGAVAVLLDGDGRVLLERRSDSGLWGLVGGGLDEGESLRDCLLREVREETGLEVTDVRLFGLFSSPRRIFAYPDGVVVSSTAAAFFARPVGDVLVASDESSELRWFDLDEVPFDELAATHRDVLTEATLQLADPARCVYAD